MLYSFTAVTTLLALLTNCTDRSVLTPTTPVVVATPPGSQTIIDAAPLPTAPPVEKLPDWGLHPMAYPSLITGKTEYVSGLKSEALTPVAANVELGTLVPTGQPLRMIALGGSLTAGVRNGGLYREGQLTAYPNLVARQMGITDFQSPTFAPQEANGTGFYVYDEQATTYPRWREVSNQKAVVQAGDPPILSAYSGVVDNYAVPGMGGSAFNFLWYPNSTAYNGTDHKWLPFQLYLWRYMPQEKNQQVGLTDDIVAAKKPYDIFLLEDKMEAWLKIFTKNDNLRLMDFIYELTIGMFEYEKSATKLLQGGKKGVVFTVPDPKDYAFMQWYRASDLKKKAPLIEIDYRDGAYQEPRIKLDPATTFYFMPTAAVARLFETHKEGDIVKATLTDADVMDQAEAVGSRPNVYNEEVVKLARKLNLALVDLNEVYRQIAQGTYLAEGGLVIDGSPKGNFFSSDGTYPTAIGQAVIANEVIKALNRTYQSRIPLINVSEFARTAGAK
ncbi:hypothetical protein [uncultured Fibrella sp.]|uniref:hypothetical protein n=1 Tax=uncultured Fibrella sp. TaxID=1284596 RepID=UPI0035C951FE